MNSLPKIFVFRSGVLPRHEIARHVGKAVAEDGTDLGGRFCSSLRWVKLDMGFGSSGGMHTKYAEHYPNGYHLVWVEDPDNHPELQAALERGRQANV